MSKEEKIIMASRGPAVSGLPVADRNMQLAVDAHGLQRLVPSFFDPAEVEVEEVLQPLDPMPRDVTAVSYTLPEVVGIWFNAYTGAEPAVNFPDVVKGISCTAFILSEDQRETAKELVELLAQQTSEGSDPPSIRADFADSVRTCLIEIFNNQEPVSYRGLLAFLIGAFWILGFVKDPMKKRGELSPLDFVREMVSHYGRLAYLPQ